MKGNRQSRELAPTVSASAFKSRAWPMMETTENKEEDAKVPLPYSETEDVILPKDFRPTKYDVINGRGKKAYNHIANRRFRQLTAMNLKRYQNAKCKVDKSLIVVGIVNSIRKASPCGGFVKKCPKSGRWVSMSDEGAREKVGHCLRDMIASQREDQSRPGKVAAAVEDRLKSKPKQTPTILTKLTHTTFNRRVLPKSKKAVSNKQVSKPVAATVSAPAAAPSRKKARDPPTNSFAPNGVDPSVAPRKLNNFDHAATAKESSQEMSQQQKNILKLLEGGWKGSIADLLELAGGVGRS